MNKVILFGAAALMAFASCDSKKSANAAETADSTQMMTEVFEGQFPLASSANGSATDTVMLSLTDGEFVRTSTAGGDTVKGKYTIADGLLTTVEGEMDTTYYSYTPDSLVMLGMDKKPAESGISYVLKKK